MQNDALMATATPREAIMFSANMRLPSNTPKEKLVALVEKLLNDLGIVECADLFIGNALIKGISGGQRKRTSVGVEVVSNPNVTCLALFLRHLQHIVDNPLFNFFAAPISGRAHDWAGLSFCLQSDSLAEEYCYQELRHPLHHPPAFFGSVCTL